MFWLVCFLFTLLVFLILFITFKWQEKTSISRNALNKAFYFHRLKEIALEEEKGLLEDKSQSQKELQQNLLQDIPAEAEENHRLHLSKRAILASSALFILMSVGLYSQMGAWQMQSRLDELQTQLPQFFARYQDQNDPLSAEEMDDFMLALRVKLQQQPHPQDWWQLGDLAYKQGKLAMAKDSFAKANQLAPEDHRYQLALARFLMFSDNKVEQVKGEQMVRQVLRAKPTLENSLEALSLLAFQYFSNKDYKMAAATWAMMLSFLPEEDPKTVVLQQSIMAAQKAMEAERK